MEDAEGRHVSAAKHPEIRVTVGDTSAMIDRGIAPLIELLWENGVRTSECCEGGGDELAAIYFSEERELTRFVTLAVEGAGVALRRRMGLQLPEAKRGAWIYGISPYQYLYGGGWRGEVFTTFVLFPTSDISLLCRAIEKAVAKSAA